jgi:hypothetical protein
MWFSWCAYRKLNPGSIDGEARAASTAQQVQSLNRKGCSELVVAPCVGRKDPAQMGFADNDDVIEVLLADRADQSLCMPVLPE